MQNHLFWMLFICGHLLQKSMGPKHPQDSYFKVQSLGLQYLYLPENKFQELGLPSPHWVQVKKNLKCSFLKKNIFSHKYIILAMLTFFFCIIFLFFVFFLLFLPTVFCAGFTRLCCIRSSNKPMEGQCCSNQKYR